jgi:hypothetical protein
VHLAISYVDRICGSGYSLAGEDSTGVVCLLLASKFNEVDDNIPLVGDLGKVYGRLSGCGLDLEGVRERETEICQLFNWELDTIIPLHFINNLVQQGIIYSNDSDKREATLL